MSEFPRDHPLRAHALGPIPPEFHRECGDGPFERCDVCGEPFGLRQYSLIKEYRRAGPDDLRGLFEFALCHGCAAELGEHISEESAARLLELEGESRGGESASPTDCTSCGTRLTELSRWSTRIRCVGDLGVGVPEVFCEHCEQRLAQALSRATRDDLEGWFREHVPGVPGSEIDIETLLSKL